MCFRCGGESVRAELKTYVRERDCKENSMRIISKFYAILPYVTISLKIALNLYALINLLHYHVSPYITM